MAEGPCPRSGPEGNLAFVPLPRCRDIPRAILGSLLICAVLYIAVCLVLTGMVPYDTIDQAAPLSSAFQE
jgi:hypothetical protein